MDEAADVCGSGERQNHMHKKMTLHAQSCNLAQSPARLAVVRSHRAEQIIELRYHPARKLRAALDPEEWLALRGPGLPMDLVIRLAPDEQGRPVCVGLILGLEFKWELQPANTEITSRDLREIPLGKIIDEIVRQNEGFDDADLSRAKRRKPHRRPGRAGVPRDELEDFATGYVKWRAITPRRDLAKTLASQFNLSESTARRWMKRCEEEGLVEPIALPTAEEVER
jgi:hypothetical protein